MKLFLFITLAALGIIPAPKQSEQLEGFFENKRDYAIVFSGKENLDDFKTYLGIVGYKAATKNASVKFYIGDKYFKGTLPYGTDLCEGYELNVTAGGAVVKAATTAGAFYALQTIRQIEKGGKLPCCKVVDEPAMGHRGLMFDVVRHFRSVDFICHQLDAMAALKMNRMHFHLTDSQAWRIKLDCHPEMVTTAFRPNIRMLRNENTYIAEPAGYVPGTLNFEEGCYGGYYTKENIRQILEYARLRHIEVIPEIEMPGHSQELLNVHKELRCNCKQLTRNSVCPGKEATFTFFQEVLEEVMELFPSVYMHIGGDEASKKNWAICPDCQRRMKEENLKTVEELQSYLVGRMEKFIRAHGKKMIGWDEIMEGGLCDNAIVMSWRGTEHGYKAIEQGHDVIFSPTTYFYLDYYQGYPASEPMSIGSHIPLSKCYSAPIYAGKHIIGVQGNLWAEYITSDKHYEYMLYPRAFAIAEIGWSPRELRGDYADFAERVKTLTKDFNAKGFAVHDIEKDQRLEDNCRPIEHLARGAKVEVVGSKHSKAKTGMTSYLTDGWQGNGSVSESWYRMNGKTTLTVDLGKACDIHYVGANFLHYRHSYIPSNVEVSVSADGTSYKSLGRRWGTAYNCTPYDRLKSRDFNPQTDTKQVYGEPEGASWASSVFPFVCNEKSIRYVRYTVTPQEGCNGMSVDELVIN